MTADQRPGLDRKLTRRRLCGLLVPFSVALLIPAFRPNEVSAVTLKQAAVRLSEVSIQIVKDPSGNIISETKGVRAGNDYVLSPTQERGRERAQSVLVRIGADGVARERIKVMSQDGSHFWRDGGDTFVFSGVQDAQAPVDDCCERIVERPGMNIDVYRVRPRAVLERFLTFPTAFDCNPRDQKVNDEIVSVQTPIEPIPIPTPAPIPTRPVPAPVQKPRASTEPSLSAEFGSVEIVPRGQLGRIIYE